MTAPGYFVSDFLSIPAWDEQNWMLKYCQFEVLEEQPPERRAVSEACHVALKSWAALTPEGKEKFIELGWQPSEQKAKPLAFLESSWIANASIRRMDQVLCSASEMHEQGHSVLRTEMLTDFLAASGVSVGNTTMFVRHLSTKAPPLLEIIEEAPGRNGLSFKLTEAGKKQADKIKAQYAVNS